MLIFVRRVFIHKASCTACFSHTACFSMTPSMPYITKYIYELISEY